MLVNPKKSMLAGREGKDFSNCAIAIRAHVKSCKSSTIPEREKTSPITLKSEFEQDFSWLLQLHRFPSIKTI
jgi:hypothetical protein